MSNKQEDGKAAITCSVDTNLNVIKLLISEV